MSSISSKTTEPPRFPSCVVEWLNSKQLFFMPYLHSTNDPTVQLDSLVQSEGLLPHQDVTSWEILGRRAPRPHHSLLQRRLQRCCDKQQWSASTDTSAASVVPASWIIHNCPLNDWNKKGTLRVVEHGRTSALGLRKTHIASSTIPSGTCKPSAATSMAKSSSRATNIFKLLLAAH